MKTWISTNSVTLVLFAVCSLFLARTVWVATHNIGIEHDSGWYIGLAKNLALHGKYATSVNTVENEAPGAHRSIHQRKSVQDQDGLTYFPAGVTVGPGYALPQALLIKIAYLFGADRDAFWPLQTWPIIAFFLLLFLSSKLVHRWGGAIGVALFFLWLWCIPIFWIQFSYEAFSEPAAVLFILIGILYLPEPPERTTSWRSTQLGFFLAGLALSSAVLTKTLSALALPAFLLALWPFQHRLLGSSWPLFAGIMIPYATFEIYKNLYLLSHFGRVAVQAVAEDAKTHFQTAGALVPMKHFWNVGFWLQKARLWMDLGFTFPMSVWGVLLMSPWVLLRDPYLTLRTTLSTLFFFILTHLVWFVFLSGTGWGRHGWPVVFLGAVLISAAFGKSVHTIWENRGRVRRAWPCLVFLLIFFFNALTISPTYLEPRVNLTKEVLNDWHEMRNFRGSNMGFPSVTLFSYEDQKDLQHFFRTKVSDHDRLHYLGWLLVAEAPAFVDKTVYPVGRYFRNPAFDLGGRNLLIFGPYQMGSRAFYDSSYLKHETQRYCEKILFSNSSYRVCELRKLGS